MLNKNLDILKKILSILARISISALLLYFLFRQVDSKSIWDIIKGADWALLFLGFLINALSYLLGVYRWKMYLDGAGVRLPFKRVLISFSGGPFFNLFLPSTIGGDVVKGIDLAMHTKKPKEIVASMLLDRLSGYAAMVIISVTAVLLGYHLINDPIVLLVVGLVTFVLVCAFLTLFNNFIFEKVSKFLNKKGGRIAGALQRLHQEIYLFRNRKKLLVKNFLLSMVIQASAPLAFYVIALSLGLKTNIIYFFILIPVIAAITMLPVSIGGLGLRDASTIFFFAKVGIDNHVSFAISLLGFFYILVISVMGGILYVFTLHSRRLQYRQAG
ncbi:MAG: lysylphosphatidylglycerol synthase transmembrane domain-containing protein [Candidatus Omnitrophica bacterium]|nr:lysylphosphatidylglycerol synthase transmembrane domain-containing protein [Candidatus Omnitrophota bacterium]